MSPEPTSTATAQPAVPEPALPLSCDALVPLTEVQSIVGHPVELREDGTRPGTAIGIAARQAGLLTCIWGGEDRTDNSYDQTLVIHVLADADTAWDAGVWQVDDGAVVYPEGSTTSEYLCQPVMESASSWGGLAYCDANVLVDGYWARMHVQAVQTDDAEAASTMKGLVDAIIERLAGAGAPRAGWRPPSDALTPVGCGPQTSSSPSFIQGVAAERAGLRSCSGLGATVAVVPGGAWAVELADGARATYSITLAPIEVAGVDRALAGCADGCAALVAVGGSAISIYADVYSLDEFLPMVAPIVAELVSS